MKKILGLVFIIIFISCACSKNEKVVVKIGKDKITVGEFEQRLQEAQQAYRGYLDTPSGRRQFLDLIIRERLVIEDARRLGYNKKKDYKQSINDFKKAQERRMKGYQESLLMEMYVSDLHQKAIVSGDDEIEEYYKNNKKDFRSPKEITISHILLANEEDAQKALKRLKSGESFSKVASEMSIDPVSAAKGGEIGAFRKGDLIPEFEKSVMSLKVGQISGVVKSRFGYHILKKTKEKSLPAFSSQDAKKEIKRILEKQKFDAWIEQVKNNYNLKVNYDLINSIPPLSLPEEKGEESDKAVKKEKTS